MDFLEDLEDYNSAMDNAYNLVTKRITLDDIFEAAESEGELVNFYLPFDSLDSDVRDEGTLDLLIEHFT